MPGGNSEQRSFREELDRFFTTFRRGAAYWKRSFLVFVLIAGSVLAFVLLSPRSYRSETVVVYQEAMRSTDIAAGEDRDNSARRVGARLREVLLSRVTLEPMIKELGLYPDIMDRRGLVDAVDEMRKHIAFKAGEGDTFEISFEADSPQRAQDVTKRLADSVLGEASSRRSEQAKILKEFLEAESARNKVELRNKEEQLAKFLTAHPAFAKPTQGEVHTTTAPLTAGVNDPDPTLTALEWKAALIDRQLKAAPGEEIAPPPMPKAPAPPPKLAESPELTTARKDYEEKASRFTDKHPDVIAARARLRSAEATQAVAQTKANEAYVAALASAAAEPPPAPVKPATSENRDALTRQLADLKAQIRARRVANPEVAKVDVDAAAAPAPVATGAVGLEVEFNRVKREAEDARDRQHLLDDRLFKAEMTASSVSAERNIQLSILDPAYLPTHPSSRPRSLVFGIGLAAALFFAIAIAFLSARLDDRIYDRFDLEIINVMPVIGVIPRARLPAKKG